MRRNIPEVLTAMGQEDS